jgi:hypothetical protein
VAAKSLAIRINPQFGQLNYTCSKSPSRPLSPAMSRPSARNSATSAERTAYVPGHIDASGLIFALLARSDQAVGLRRRLAAEVCHAPHLIDAEVGNALRRQVPRGSLPAADAEILFRFGAPLVDPRSSA